MTIYGATSGFSVTNYAIGLLFFLLALLWIRTRSLSYVLCAAIFGVYLLFVASLTLFPMHVSGGFADAMRDGSFMGGVNLIPFNFSPYSGMGSIIEHLALNILLLVPFGFGVSFVAPVKPKHLGWILLIGGFGIEAVQLVIGLILQYPYRAIDINDVMMNVLGTLIGYGGFRLFAWLYLRLSRRLAVQTIGIGRYIHQVASRGGHPNLLPERNAGSSH
ncbi:MAG: VanZ family protein [Anaerolineae bacterium]|jgi:glycopeptide antibiotics resistance protein|nr:VanZ family protein [Anaerolineae bacterium]